MKRYEVTCLKCKESDVLLIEDDQHAIVNFGKGAGTNLLAGRWRGSKDWGWECICGNDNRISNQESEYLDQLVTRGDAKTIDDIKKSLNVPDSKQFRMAVV